MKQILHKSFALKAFMLVAMMVSAITGAWAETYRKITSTSDLEINKTYLLVCESENQAFAGIAKYGSNYVGDHVDVTISDDYTITSNNVIPFTLLGGATTGWELYVQDQGYLTWSSGNTLASGSTASRWNISFTNGNVFIAFVNESSRKIRFNKANPRFACYTTDQTDIQLYKEVEEDPSDTRTPVTLTWSATTATATLGETFTAPTLTIDPSAASSAVTYSSDDPDVASIDAAGNITIEGAGEVTIKAEIKDNTTYKDASASYTLTVIDPNVPGATAENPYTVAQAIAAIDAGTGTSNVYVKGIISQIDSYNSTYGSITYWISEDGTTTDQFEVYGGLNIGGTQFSGLDDLKLGAEVVVYGNIKKYNTTYEFDKNNELVSITFSEKAEAGLAYETIAFTINNADDFQAPTLTNPYNLNVTYSSSNEDVAIVNTNTGAISIEGVGTATITATFEGDDNYLPATASYTINVVDANAPGATAENPYSVGDVLQLFIDNNVPTTAVYVKGFISEINSQSSSYKNARYYISDDGTTTNQFYVYNGKYLEGSDFTEDGQILVGDEVIIYGTLTTYNGTNEFAANNYIVSLTRPTTIPVPTFTPAAGEVDAGTTVAINVPSDEIVDYVEYSYDQENWTEYNDEVPFTINEETTIYARSVSTEGTSSAVVSASYTIKSTPIAEDVVIVEDDKTTFLFNTKGNEWGLPVGSTNKATAEAEFTANNKTIILSAADGYYYNETGMLMLGKAESYLTLPAFDFAVGKIEVVGKAGASGTVKQNIFVGNEAVSTETEGATGSNSYIIAPNYQAAGNVYSLKVLSNHNTQITKVIVYKATGEEKANPQLKFSETTASATLGEEFTAPTLSYIEGFDGSISYTSDNEEVATIDAEGVVTLIAAGTAVITASFAGNATYEAAEASYTLTVKNAAVIGTDKFELVTDASTLASGDIIIIVGTDEESNAYALGTNQKTNNRGAVAVTIESADGTITPNSDVQQITLEEGWYFNVGNGYLYASSSSSNQLKTETEVDDKDNAKATIVTDNNSATIVFQGSNTRKNLRFNYNNGDPLFACYANDATTGTLPQIYRKIASDTPSLEGDVNNDGNVTIADVTALVNIILGHPGEGVNMDAADVNGDGNVTIADVTALVNKILKQ